VRIDAGEALHYVKRLALPNSFDARGHTGGDPTLVVVVGSVDDQRASFPPPSRVSVPQLHVRWQMRPAIDRDDAGIVDHLRKEDDITGDLHDLIRVVICGRKHAAGDATRDTSIHTLMYS